MIYLSNTVSLPTAWDNRMLEDCHKEVSIQSMHQNDLLPQAQGWHE